MRVTRALILLFAVAIAGEAMREDEYLNCLKASYGYAVTCHKAQGGQWDAVFVDQGYVTEEMINMDFLRWFYTAITRATTELFLVNFDNRFYATNVDSFF